MYFDEPAPGFVPMRLELRLVLGVTGLFVMLFGAYPRPLVDAAAAAAKSLF
jgi:NADH-quinone oxidoreductase subunit N